MSRKMMSKLVKSNQTNDWVVEDEDGSRWKQLFDRSHKWRLCVTEGENRQRKETGQWRDTLIIISTVVVFITQIWKNEEKPIERKRVANGQLAPKNGRPIDSRKHRKKRNCAKSRFQIDPSRFVKLLAANRVADVPKSIEKWWITRFESNKEKLKMKKVKKELNEASNFFAIDLSKCLQIYEKAKDVQFGAIHRSIIDFSFSSVKAKLILDCTNVCRIKGRPSAGAKIQMQRPFRKWKMYLGGRTNKQRIKQDNECPLSRSRRNRRNLDQN